MKFYPKIIALFLIPFLMGLMFSEPSFSAEKKDKAARKAALMMQKMKQDMEAMQAQFATEKKVLEDQLKAETEAKTLVESKLSSAEAKARSLGAQLSKAQEEKTALDAQLTQTKTELQSTQTNLTDLKTQHQKALADLNFNDGQRKTLSTNLADTTKSLNTCEEKNGKLYAYGKELVQLYDDPSRYEAVMRKEKFFQLKRVELENILQNQQDKLDEARFVRPTKPY
jgi:chromosome segregation ATPase